MNTEQSLNANPAGDATFPDTTESPEPQVKLILRTPKKDCTHEKAVEEHKNRFYCLDCGFEYRKVRESALRRRKMLRW